MKLTAELGSHSYDIIIKRGVLARAGHLVNLGGKVLLATSKGLPQKYVKAVAAQCAAPCIFQLPDGEAAKSLDHVRALQSRMLAEGFGRTDTLLALGGGAVADTVGFAAATYMRGIEYLLLPTTTSSQIGSAGGYCRLDENGEKDVVGVVHQPSIVVIDPDVLATLDARHFASGLAEALKLALVASSDLFEILERDDLPADIERIIYLSLLYKKSIIERDETGLGERNLLHFGHTIGNALEAAGGFSSLLHGEAVALGMLPMIETRTLVRRTRAIMRRLGLPLKHSLDVQDILRHLTFDSGREEGSYTVTRVKHAGHGYLEKISGEELALLAAGEESAQAPRP